MHHNAFRTAAITVFASTGVLAACVLPGVAHAGAPEPIGGGIDLGSVGAPDRLDPDSAARGITKVLNDSYGIDDVANVRCPERMPVTPGSEYACTLKVAGAPKTVIILIKDSDGTYEVGRPS
ncbi:DUF4333 domain-containing protein [Nocardia sp. NPDC055321]